MMGCSGSSRPYDTAPVSGVITLDGQPLAGARVTFLPVHDARSGLESCPEAFGETDASGRYQLKTVFGDPGGSVGHNRVMVTTRKFEPDPANPERVKEIATERVPSRYFTDKQPLTIDVPTAGTRTANFELTSK
jgi:hypothetical protein